MNMMVSTALVGTAISTPTPKAAASEVSLPTNSPDPVFAQIKAAKREKKAFFDICDKFEDGVHAAQEAHGRQPFTLITWRNYTIGGGEIEERRDVLLSQPGADAEQIEREYTDAKARERSALCAERSWFERAGLNELLKERECVRAAYCKSEKRLSVTKPTTAAGAAAVLQYLVKDQLCMELPWHAAAMKTVVAALRAFDRREA